MKKQYLESLALPEEQTERITGENLFSHVAGLLENDYSELFEILDYCLSDSYGKGFTEVIDPEEYRVFGEVDYGGSEGVYLDVYLGDPHRGNPVHIGTLKTLEDGRDAFAKMGMLSGLFTKYGEDFLHKNYKAITQSYKRKHC